MVIQELRLRRKHVGYHSGFRDGKDSGRRQTYCDFQWFVVRLLIVVIEFGPVVAFDIPLGKPVKIRKAKGVGV